jgi:hypothetical protein
MSHRALVTGAIVVVIAAVSAYLLLSGLRDGIYPDRKDVEEFFGDRRDGFESLYRQLVEDGYASVLCYPDKVFAGFDPRGPGQPLLGDALDEYLPLCQQAFAGKGWRIDEGFLFHMGAAANDAFDFNLSLVRLDAADIDIPDCRTTEPSGELGRCQFKLDEDWRLDYEWYAVADR